MSLLTTRIWPILFMLCCSGVVALAQLSASGCSDDEQIATEKRAEVDSAAMQFFTTLIGADPARAYDQLAPDAQKNITREQIAGISASMLQSMKVERLRVEHTYYATFAASDEGRVVCGNQSEGKWVSVAVRPGEQAHVLLSADFVNGRFAFHAWVVPDGGKWKIKSFWLGASSLAEYDGEKIWSLARSEASKEHRFNATVLYNAALQLTNRGQHLQLGISNEISKEAASYSPPSELAGQPPYEWKDGSSTYRILDLGPTAIAGKLYLVMNHQTSPWTSEKEVDGRNKKLGAHFKRIFPEYRDVFSGIIIRAHERGTSRGFGTVEEDRGTGPK